MKVRKLVVPVTATLAVCGVLGAAPAAGQARPAVAPTWTEQAPATHPLGRSGAAMAYDAATGTAVLFGGVGGRLKILKFADIWTWDGSTWTKQAPAASPPAWGAAGMAYDAATHSVVLFGGPNGDTWTWNGSTWAKQAPAASPSPRAGAGMAYDAATGTVVLFGGIGYSTGRYLGDTWTWDGTTWTRQNPAASPATGVNPAMAYDAATGSVVLFGGYTGRGPRPYHYHRGTWTWG